MRHSNTGKSDPQPAPSKRGFFAAAGERLKRAMSGGRAPAAAVATSIDQSAPETQDGADAGESEVTTSVQARARELLQQDRAHKRTRKRESSGDSGERLEADVEVVVEGEVEALNGAVRARKTSPPPLPSQRTAAESTVAQPAQEPEVPSELAVKRRERDAKREALRARLGAAKAQLAEAQAKRADADLNVEDASAVGLVLQGDSAEPTAADSGEPDRQGDSVETAPASAADSATAADSGGPKPAAAKSGTPQPPPPAGRQSQPPAAPAAEPIRTLTIARLLARQGYFDRSLSIYDQLLAESKDDPELRAEADRVRAQANE